MNNKLMTKEVNVNGKEGEITDIKGLWYEVTFFNANDGKTIIYKDDVEKFLV